MAGVPADVLTQLATGEAETVNLMEWLAADMSALARAIAAKIDSPALSSALVEAADEMIGKGVTHRLKIAGKAIASHAPPGSLEFATLASHKSDLIRQWVCYAANDSSLSLSLNRRLQEALPFAADRNMSVREAAWMAFRPHLTKHFDRALPLLEDLAGDPDDNIRRFAVEVTRPRSVWGAHLHVLKYDPGRATALLERIKTDPSRYVKLAAGNWLNDASKTRPDWVIDLCRRWSGAGDPHTSFIVKRGLRTVAAKQRQASAEPALPLSCAHIPNLEPMENELC